MVWCRSTKFRSSIKPAELLPKTSQLLKISRIGALAAKPTPQASQATCAALHQWNTGQAPSPQSMDRWEVPLHGLHQLAYMVSVQQHLWFNRVCRKGLNCKQKRKYHQFPQVPDHLWVLLPSFLANYHETVTEPKMSWFFDVDIGESLGWRFQPWSLSSQKDYVIHRNHQDQ